MSELGAADHEQLKRLEESLWRSETRFDRDHMERILAPGFIEFGRSGRVYSRTEILALPPRAVDATLRDLTVRPLADGVALLTYLSEVHSDGDGELANRSSIWTRSDGQWTLLFHQGTPTT